MLQRKLRKDFMRAVYKATLILALPLSLATTALAQETPATKTGADAPQMEQTQQVQDTLFLKEGGTVSVLPQTEISIDTAEKKYPFLKDVLSDIRSYNEEIKDSPTRLFSSTLKDTDTNIEFLFVMLEGPLTCGASQCQLRMFVNNGEGYAPLDAFPAQFPFYVVKENKEISLFFCSEQGRSQWVFSNGALTHKENTTAPQSGPSCNN